MHVDSETFLRHKLVNLLRASLLLSGMLLLLGLMGWLLGGWYGVLWAVLVGAVVLVVAPGVQPRLILARSGARRLPPEAAPVLYEVLERLYQRAGIQAAPQLWYVPSAALNAFAVGGRRSGAIAVTAGLLRALSLRQIAGVLAHETSHLRHNDTWVMALASLITELTSWIALFGQVMILLAIPYALAGEVDIPWLVLLILVTVPTLSTLLQLSLSRNQEFNADLEAARLTGDPEGLAEALTRLERSRGAWLHRVFLPRRRPTWVPGWLRTHPETGERVKRLLDLAATPDMQPIVPLRTPLRAPHGVRASWGMRGPRSVGRRVFRL